MFDMKRMIFASLSCLVITSVVQSAEPLVKLSKEEVTSIFDSYFCKKTKIVEGLADKELDPLEVAITFEKALYDFAEYVGKDSKMYWMLQERKSSLLRRLLKNYPDAKKA